MTKICTRYCRIDNTEYFPSTEYKVEFNPVDNYLRIYDCWGSRIVSLKFINENFI